MNYSNISGSGLFSWSLFPPCVHADAPHKIAASIALGAKLALLIKN